GIGAATEGMVRKVVLTDSRGVEFPGVSLSDGTVKALALLVGIFAQRSSTAIIEEPENFLHPWACQTMVELLRDRFKDAVCILTSHSET
ncbi:unnamed protein product, partial [marine sediment metagenome]